MPLPRVAIVGRPNVGKSSLMNMLAGAKVSIVDPTPGVTRDRVTALVELRGADPTAPHKLVEITDTGGYGVYVADGARFDDAGEDLARLTGAIEGQIAAAAERADLILLVVDAQSGITALDQTIARLLRERLTRGPRPQPPMIRVVANKVDAENWEAYAGDASSLGFGEPLIVSARTNFRRRDFTERLFEIVPAPTPDQEKAARPEMKMALVGRRNAGKSSLVNTLAGEERCIVSEIAGTTRDAIDVRFEIDGRTALAIDTAGVRRRTKFADAVEYWAFDRCLLAIGRADVVLMLLDATQEITGIDKRLGARVLAENKPCAIVVTKWDLAKGRKNRKGERVTPEDYAQYISEELTGMAYCPVVFTSSPLRQGLREMVDVAFDLFNQARGRVSTSRLNDLVRGILSERGPSSKLGTKAKVLYVTQVGVQPPTIVMVVNHPEMFTPSYRRYLQNRLHEALPFAEVPIRLIIRERDRMGLSALMRRGEQTAYDDEQARLIEPTGSMESEGFDLEHAGVLEELAGVQPLGDHDSDEESPAFDEAEEWLDDAEDDDTDGPGFALVIDEEEEDGEQDHEEDDDEEVDLSDLQDAPALPLRTPRAQVRGAPAKTPARPGRAGQDAPAPARKPGKQGAGKSAGRSSAGPSGGGASAKKGAGKGAAKSKASGGSASRGASRTRPGSTPSRDAAQAGERGSSRSRPGAKPSRGGPQEGPRPGGRSGSSQGPKPGGQRQGTGPGNTRGGKPSKNRGRR